MFIVAFVGTLVFLAIVNFCVWNPKGYGVAAIVSLLTLAASLFACGGAIFLPPVIITSLLLFVGSLVFANRESKVVHFRIFSLGAGVVGLIAGVGFSLSHVKHMHELRKQYPMESLAPRLAYEVQHSQPEAGPKGASAIFMVPPPAGTPAWTNLALDEKESNPHWNRREPALREIHASTVEQFSEAPGFGVGRMSSVSDYWLKKRRRPPAPLSPPRDESPTAPSGPLLTGRKPFDGSQSHLALNDQLTSIHRTGVRDFVDPVSFGWVVDREHVAGFESHHFSGDFRPDFVASGTDDYHLELTRLELVSLLKFDTARVYVSNQNLPQLDQLREAPTRTLNPFESAALPLLQKGEDLVFNEHGPHVVAFGSLRASAQCLKCHEVARGALLGAFSYQFDRDTLPQSSKPTATDRPPG